MQLPTAKKTTRTCLFPGEALRPPRPVALATAHGAPASRPRRHLQRQRRGDVARRPWKLTTMTMMSKMATEAGRRRRR
jgi:hypothetical protein